MGLKHFLVGTPNLRQALFSCFLLHFGLFSKIPTLEATKTNATQTHVEFLGRRFT